MAAAPKVNLLINQGATFRYKFTWKDARKRLIDITDFVGRMHVRTTVDAISPLVSLTTENGGIQLGSTAGTVSLYINAAVTAGYSWRTGVYDVELESPTGEIFRIVEGTVTVSPEVTR